MSLLIPKARFPEANFFRELLANFEKFSGDYQTALRNYHERIKVFSDSICLQSFIQGMIEVIDKHKRE